MQRCVLIFVLIAASCAPSSYMYAPQSFVVGGLQLSQANRAEIARVVSRQTDQRISSIYPGNDKDSIEFSCGYLDELSYGQRLTGDEFTLKRINGQWTVADKGSWIR